MLDIAAGRGVYGVLEKGDLTERLPFKDGAFDALLCVGTTTYLKPDVLEDWARVLTPGGVMLFTHKTAVWPLWGRAGWGRVCMQNFSKQYVVPGVG